MAHKHGVLHINLYVVIITGKMRVHVNQTEKIETQGRRQTAQEHSNKE